MAGKARIKRIRVTKSGNPARVITFTTRGVGSNMYYFVHRYNPSEFDELIGKSEDAALEWLVCNRWEVHWITGK